MTPRPRRGWRSAWAVAVVLAGACGGDDGTQVTPTDAVDLDAPAYSSPPNLGPQLDRVGRPMVQTLLIALLEPLPQRATAMRDAYERANDPAAWATAVLDPVAIPPLTVEAELAANLGVLDGLDLGHPDVVQSGCGNSPLYQGPPTASSYHELAAIFADDQLYLDTERTVCDRYFAIERAAFSGQPTTRCGGRTLTHDVIDDSYSLLMGGVAGFTADPASTPHIGDGAPAHANVDDAAFPFLASPR